MTNSFRRAFPIAVLLVLCVPFLSLTSPVRAQGGPSETILDAIFNDLSSRIGKSVSWRRMDGQYLWEEVAVSNDNLGCTVGAGAAPGVTRAWKVDITLRDVGSYEYRTTLNGGVILYCTGTGLGATTGGADPTAPPPVIPVAGGKVAVEALGTTTTTTYNIPVLAYVGDSGNVRVLQAAPNVPATNVTGDANGGRDAASPYWTADAYYDNLTWSPDGSRFAFTKRTENSQELYVATSGSAPLRVATGIMTEIGVAWSLDGTSVLYPVFTGQPSATNPNDVLIQVQGVLATGGQPFVAGSFAFGVGCGGGGYSAAYQRAMMDTGYEGSQKRLVYTGQGILHTTNCTGRGMALTGFDGTVRWTLPNYGRFALSPDGLKIAAVQFAADGSPTSTGLAIIDLVSGAITPLATLPGVDRVVWLPGGATLVYTTNVLSRTVSPPPGSGLDPISGGNGAVNSLGLHTVPATGGASTTLYTTEGFAFGTLSASTQTNLIAFTLITSDAEMILASANGMAAALAAAPVWRIGLTPTLPNQPGYPFFLAGNGMKPVLSTGSAFVAVPAQITGAGSISGTSGNNPLGLVVGGQAYVPAGGNVNVRRQPAVAADNVVGLLRPGDVVIIQSGPQVVNGLRWWNVVRTPDGLSGWVVDQFTNAAGNIENNLMPR